MKHRLVRDPAGAPAKRRFRTGWFLAFAIPLLIVAGILFAFSKFLYGIEYYSPSVELEKYVKAVGDRDYAAALEMLGISGTSFNGPDEYAAFFKTYYGSTVKTYVYVERKLQRTERDVFFDLSINKKPAQKFRLTKTGAKRLFLFDTWKISTADPFPAQSVTIRSVPGVTVTLNGQPVGDEYLLDDPGFTLDPYKNVKDEKSTIAVRAWRVDGVIAVTSVTAADADGTPCEVELTDDAVGAPVYMAHAPIPDSRADALKAAALEITKTYSEFIAKDVSFSKLSPYLYKNSLFYDNLLEFYNGWFTGHESYGFENIRYFGLERYDDSHYRVGIAMDYYVYKKDKRYDYDIKYNLYLLKSGEKWLLADLSIQ